MAYKFSLNHLSVWSQRSMETMFISLMSYDISVNSATPSSVQPQSCI